MGARTLHPNLIVKSLVDELTVRCTEGCGWTGRHDTQTTHLAACPARMLRVTKGKLSAEVDGLRAVIHGLRAELDDSRAKLEASRALEADQRRELLLLRRQVGEMAQKLAENTKDYDAEVALLAARLHAEAAVAEAERAKVLVEKARKRAEDGLPTVKRARTQPRAESAPRTFQVFVRTWVGKSITLQVSPSDYIETVHDTMQLKEGISPDACYFVYKGKRLELDRTVADYGISRDATLHLSGRLRSERTYMPALGRNGSAAVHGTREK